jgi:VCBS repeat protein
MGRQVLLLFAAFLALAVAGALVPSPSTAAPPSCNVQSLFGPPVVSTTGPNPLYVVSRDFDEDGILDLAVTNSDVLNGGFNSSVAILLGLGGTSYAAPVLYPVGVNPHMLAPGDFNEDGILDLVVANKWSSSLSVLIGQGSGGVGNGTFAAAVDYPTPGYPFQIVVEDFNGDGIVDLAVSINDIAAVALLRGGGSAGLGDGTFIPAGSLPINAPSTGLERGDFDLDGITDLVATENAIGTIAVLRGTGSPVLGTGSFAPATHVPGGLVPFEFAVADFNEDGKPDLAVAEQYSGGGTRVMLGNGDGTFQLLTTLPTDNTTVVAPDDLNQDGITDLAIGTITGSGTGNVRVFLGLGTGGVGNGSFGLPSSYGPVGDAYQLIAGDFDGDSRRDLVVTYSWNSTIAVQPGTCDGGIPLPPDPRFPFLTDVRDVPNDQGGYVFLTWTASSLDVPGGAVNAYRVWRRIPPALMSQRLASGTTPAGLLARPVDEATSALIEYWEAVVTLPAQRLAGYGYTAPTTQDSMRHSNPYTAFFVTALTNNIDVFYSSNVDSGYSVDNLRPRGPDGFAAQYGDGEVAMQWEATEETDVTEYRLYRGAQPDFVPGSATLLLATSDTEFVDDTPGATTSHYKLSTVDAHGNESDFALVSPPATTGVWIGTSVRGLALRQPVPNPSDGRRMNVKFALADASPARLELLDVTGRIVRARDVGSMGHGTHQLDLVGQGPLPTGLYFLRLAQSGVSAIARMAVIR